ncbi:hypothetical protein NDU88_007368 [Pleurodeles waltl]|uniref:Uncharacterized protein n=1 Tax=Pleurodeles waltl TaxID=8319 RepID=A0AAV7RUS8_PLEWA|nr:hypothetical protein NDU88_007368 [Pleurodeles waltl]
MERSGKLRLPGAAVSSTKWRTFARRGSITVAPDMIEVTVSYGIGRPQRGIYGASEIPLVTAYGLIARQRDEGVLQPAHEAGVSSLVTQ